MKTIEWSKTYSVGIGEIDAQHRRLFEIINNFYENMNARVTIVPRELIRNLEEYASTHFRTEEKYFDAFGFTDSQTHKRQHREFEARISEFKTAYLTKGTFNAASIGDFMKQWIIHHILISDRKYIQCFREHGLH
jgi:hemerythrin